LHFSSGDVDAFWQDYSAVWADISGPYRQWSLAPLGLSLARSMDQLVIGQSFPSRPINEAIKPGQSVAFAIPLVQPKGEIVNVATKVVWANMVIDANHPALQLPSQPITSTINSTYTQSGKAVS
jgi:hypothetical protein